MKNRENALWYALAFGLLCFTVSTPYLFKLDKIQETTGNLENKAITSEIYITNRASSVISSNTYASDSNIIKN